MKKKLISAVLALVIVLGLLPMAVFAEGEDGTETPVNSPAADTVKELSMQSVNQGYIVLNGGSYKLTEDVTIAAYLYVSEGENVLDLNGCTITGTSAFGPVYVGGGSLMVKNENANEGKIVGGSSTDGAVSGAIILSSTPTALTLGKGVVVEAQENQYCVVVESACTSSNLNITLNGCKLNSKGSGITVNGSFGGTATINLNNAEIKAAQHGIYQAGPATTTDNPTSVSVRDSVITAGSVGVEIRAGSLSLINSTVTGGSGTTTSAANGNGSTTENAAVAVAQHTTEKAITVSIGGTAVLTGGSALYVSNPQNNTGTTNAVKVEVDGGTFNGAVVSTDKRASVTLGGGTYSDEPKTSDGITIKTGLTAVKNGEVWNVGVAEPAKLTFAEYKGSFGTTFGDKKGTDLGTPEISDADASKTVKVTGSLNYVEWEQFSSKTDDQKGHYLPIQITVPKSGKVAIKGSTTKEVTVSNTNGDTIELAMRLDDLLNNGNGKFTVQFGEEAPYTVDCTGVTLLPEVKEDNTVKITDTGLEVSAENVGSVTIPADLEPSQLKVEVSSKKKVTADSVSNETIKSVLTNENSKVVEVKITKDSTELTNPSDLEGLQLTITIAGLDNGTVYHVFSLSSDSSVSYYGSKTAAGGTISFKTKHLTDFIAAPESAVTDNAKFIEALADSGAVKNDTSGSGLDASTAVSHSYMKAENLPDGDKTTYYGGKLTITGLIPDGKYLVTLDNGAATPEKVTLVDGSTMYAVPRIGQVVTADSSGTVTMGCQPKMKVMVFRLEKSTAVNDKNAITTENQVYGAKNNNGEFNGQGVPVTNAGQ